MSKIIDALCKVLRHVAGALMICIVICVTIQIIARSILHLSTPWTEEIARYLLIWMTFLGSPVALRKGEHLMVDLLYSKYPAKGRQWVHLLSDVSIAAFCTYLLIFGIQLCNSPVVKRFKSPAAGIPRTWVYSALPVGAALMLLIALYDVYNTYQIMKGKREDTTAGTVIDESITLAEIDERRREGLK
ncbi:MAG: TRAP transporter small permease [Firmicutes bacterium]|nr:TRAP transporter small permease [Bacillota bacterium]